MRKKTLIIILSIVTILFISGMVVISVTKAKETAALVNSNPQGDDYTYIPPTKKGNVPEVSEAPSKDAFVPATEMDLDPSSLTVLVNKEHPLPKDYKPDNLVTPNIYFDLTYYDDRTLMRPEAAEAIEDLFAAAQVAGYELCGISGYRSYERQQKIFTDNILAKGKELTLTYSAVPGTSEHQTGLAMDLSCKSVNFSLNDNFAETPEGQWLADNAYRYGYIIRYPKEKTEITGYSYEPWHIRYVGKELATYLYENDLTLDEYYHYTPSEDFDFETQYAYLINITPAATITPADGKKLIVGENGEIIDEVTGDEADKSGKGAKPTGTVDKPTPKQGQATVTPKASSDGENSSGEVPPQDTTETDSNQGQSDSDDTDTGADSDNSTDLDDSDATGTPNGDASDDITVSPAPTPTPPDNASEHSSATNNG